MTLEFSCRTLQTLVGKECVGLCQPRRISARAVGRKGEVIVIAKWSQRSSQGGDCVCGRRLLEVNKNNSLWSKS